MQIGVIGRLIRTFASEQSPLELTIVHADTPTLLENQSRNNVSQQAAIFARLTQRLADAGATFVAVTSIAGHFCRKEFEARSPLPVIDLVDVVDRAVSQSGVRRIGILGTRVVMASRLYGGITSADVLPPDDATLEKVHAAYVAMAVAGNANDNQRGTFHEAARRLIDDQGAEAIMLGGTDLALVFDEQNAPFPLIDCAAVHADAIARRALVQGL